MVNAMNSIRLVCGLASAAFLMALAACDQTTEEYPSIHYPRQEVEWTGDEKKQGLFGEGGLNIFGPSDKKGNAEGGGIGVNAYLWRATLDTVSFLPLTSADPFGGVIITDWYQPPESPTERLKLTIIILDRQLRADGLRVSVFRQVRGADGNWVDAKVDTKTATQMEDAILAKARELRITDNTKS
jgi:hypothetical protein